MYAKIKHDFKMQTKEEKNSAVDLVKMSYMGITIVVGYEGVLHCDIVRCRNGLANEDTMDDYFSVYA
jgi:hypothetical protein